MSNRWRVGVLTLAAACAGLTALSACDNDKPEAKGVVSGVVTDDTGQPLVSVTIETEPLTGSAVTGADGAFRLEVAPATYTVIATKGGYVASEKTDITVAAGGSAIIDFTLVPVVTRGAIAGVVRESGTQTPLAGATVTTEPATSQATSGADGKFLLSEVPPGTYEVIATKEGYVESRQLNVTVAAGATCQQTFDLAIEVLYASTCEECHLQTSKLLADLAADPFEGGGETASTGEG